MFLINSPTVLIEDRLAFHILDQHCMFMDFLPGLDDPDWVSEHLRGRTGSVLFAVRPVVSSGMALESTLSLMLRARKSRMVSFIRLFSAVTDVSWALRVLTESCRVVFSSVRVSVRAWLCSRLWRSALNSPRSTSMTVSPASSPESFFSIELSMSPTSVSHGGLDVDGGVAELQGEPSKNGSLLGEELSLPLLVQTVFSFFMLQILFKHSSMFWFQMIQIVSSQSVVPFRLKGIKTGDDEKCKTLVSLRREVVWLMFSSTGTPFWLSYCLARVELQTAKSRHFRDPILEKLFSPKNVNG